MNHEQQPSPPGAGSTGGGKGIYDARSDARLDNIERFTESIKDRLVKIETKMESFSTKEDLHKELHSQTWKMVGVIITVCTAITAIVYFIARNIR